MSTLSFRNDVQATLWELELKGQLSDGHWENTRPDGHWRPWCNAMVVVEPANPGRDFLAAKESYQLCSKDLLDVVGRRMVSYARLCLVFGRKQAKLLERALDMDGGFRGLPEYPDHGTSTYWADIRKSLEGVNMELVEEVVNSESLFTYKDLLHELKDMKAIIKMRRGQVAP